MFSKVIQTLRPVAMQLAALTMLAAGLVSPVHADTQYWVAIGSFQNEDNALRQLDAAQRSFSDAQVVTASTAQGLVYRVVQGPFVQRASAESEVVSAIAAGFDDAWLLALNDEDDLGVAGYATYDATLAATDAYPTSDGDLPDYVPSYPTDTSAAFGLDPDRFNDTDTYSPRDNSGVSGFGTARSAREPATELVTEAPPGFSLHRLIRSVGAPSRP